MSIATGSSLLVTSISDASNGPIVAGARVRHGKATFERSGSSLRIRTGRTAIIDYSRFDIPVGTSVEFIQPDATSRVMNRINSAQPSQLMGSLAANGHVYFINRAGVVFGQDCRIDVGGLFAAGGTMTDANFLAGRDIVSNLSGSVVNHGSIKARDHVVLAGRTVVNTGAIEASAGVVALVAGDSLYMQRPGSNVRIQVAGGTASVERGIDGISTASDRAEARRARQVMATTGDLASLAMDLEGTIIARAVEVDAGDQGRVRVAGTIDATGASTGLATGGTVRITGRSVHLESASVIDASGASGGGTIHIGGGMQGGDATLRNAQNISVDAGAQIRSDATHDGHGGEIILWSDRRTDFFGNATARGAGATGNGGFVEVSGKKHLLYDGVVDVLGSGDGQSGTLLLDPGYLVVQNTASGVDTLGISTLNAQLALGNVTIQNSGVNQDSGIQWNATSTITGLNSSSLTLNAQGAGAAVNFTAAPAFGSWTGDFIVNAASGPITVGANISRTAGAITMTAGSGYAIALNSATLSTSGAITLNSPVTLGTNVTVSAGAGAVNFGSTITGSGGNRNLTVNTTGATMFSGLLSSLGALVTNAGGTTTFGADVELAGNSTLGDAVLFTSGTHNFSNSGTGTTTFSSTVGGPGSLILSAGTGLTTFTGAVGGTALGGLTIASGGGITFSSTINGAMALQINAAGTTTFTGAVGGSAALNSINVTGASTLTGGAFTTTGAQTYGTVSLGANTTLTSSGGSDITMNGTVNGARTLNLTTTGAAIFNATVGATTALTSVTATAGTVHLNGGTIRTTGAQNYGAATLGADTTLTSTSSGAVTFSSIDGSASSLAVNTSGATTLNGNASGLTSFSTDAGGSFVLGGDLTVSGNVAIGDAATIAGTSATRTVSSTAGGTIAFSSTVNGPATLHVIGGDGTITFGGAIGGSTALAGIDIDSIGAVTFSSTINGASLLAVDTLGTTTFAGTVGATTALSSIWVSGNAALNGGTLRTTGAQTYGTATLGANTTMTSTANGTIALTGALTGATRTLTINTSGATNVGAAVSGVSSFTTDSGGTNQLSADITASGAIAINGATTLAGETRTITSTGSTISFGSTINGATALELNAASTTTLSGVVGGTTALESLTVLGAVNLNGGSVTTTGAQIYGNTTLGANTTLTSTDGAELTMNGTVNGARVFVLSTAGDAIFNGAVGATTALTSITATSGGVSINGGSMRTTGVQNYGLVSLGASTTLTTTSSGAVTLAGIDGNANSLTINASGATTIAGDAFDLSAFTSDSGGTFVLGADLSVSGNIAINDPVTVTGSGVTRTVTSTSGGTIGFGSSINGPAGLRVVGGAGTVTFTGSIGGTTALSGLEVDSAGAVTFSGTLNGGMDLNIDTSGLTTLAGTVGATSALNSIWISGAAALNGATLRTNGSQQYGDITLGANTAVTSLAGGAVTFHGALEGARTLSVTSSGLTTFEQAVGANTALTSVTVSGPVRIDGGSIRTTGAQAYGALTLGTNTILTSTSSGAVGFNSTIDGNYALSIGTAGTTSFLGAVGSTAALSSLTASGPVTLTAGTITTTGSQTYGNATLGSNMLLVSQSGGDVTFGGTINGARTLDVQTTGNAIFAGAVGASTALTSIAVQNTAIINGTSMRTTGAQSYGAIELGANTTLTSTGSGDITLGGEVSNATARSLTVNTAGVTTVGGLLNNLAAFTTDSAGSNVIAADILASGAITINGATTLQGASRTITSTAGAVSFGSTLNGATDLTVAAAGATTFSGVVGGTTALNSLAVTGATTMAGGAVTTVGGQAYGNTTLSVNTTLTSTDGGVLSMNGTVNGGRTLALVTSSTSYFYGAVGASTSLTGLTVLGDLVVLGGSVRTSGAQVYGNVLLGADTTFTGSSSAAVTFGGLVSGGGDYALTVNTSGVTTFNGDVTSVTALTTDSGGSNVVGANMAASGAIAMNGATTLTSGSHVVESTAGSVTFGSTVNGGADLSVSAAGTVTFGSTVGNSTALNSLTVSGAAALNGAVTTVGSQSYDAVTLGANTTMSSTGGGDIHVHGAIEGARALTMTTSGAITLDGSVGANTALTSLTANGTLFLNGGLVRTSGAQTYGALVLGSNTALTGTGSSAITLNGAVDGNGCALVINTAGATVFNGGIASVGSLLTDSPGSNQVNSDIAGIGALTFNGATTLSGTRSISSSAGGVTFGSTLNGASALTVSAAGLTTFGGSVGGSTALVSLTVEGAALLSGGAVRTASDQSYGSLFLGANAALTSTSDGDISIDGATGNGFALQVNTSGNTYLNGAIGGLESFQTDSPGTTVLSGSISALGNVSLLDAVMASVGANAVESTLGTIVFGSTIDGPGSLSVSAGGGTTFGGDVGANGAQAALSVSGASTFGATATVQVEDTLYFGGNVSAGLFDLSLNAPHIVFAPGVTVQGATLNISGTMKGLGDLTLSASNVLQLRGDLWTDGALDLGTPASIQLAGTISCLGTLNVNSALRVEGACMITARGGGNAIFHSTIDGTTFEADSLYVRSQGLTAFDMAVGESMRMLELRTGKQGTVKVAPVANAVRVIYGELSNGAVDTGGVTFAKAVSSVWMPPLPTAVNTAVGSFETSSAVTEALQDALTEEMK